MTKKLVRKLATRLTNSIHSFQKKKVVVVYSGGMDSTVLLEKIFREASEVTAISFDYGQRHRKELEAAAKFCRKRGIVHRIIDISNIKQVLGGSALTDNLVVPHGHYAEESMKATVVPNRNAIMLNIAIAWAVSLEYDMVATAVHAGDHAIYPDCRPRFIAAVSRVAAIANYHPVHVIAPFIYMTKGEIACLGKILDLDLREVSWSCYEGGSAHCGKCGTCVEREEAFQEAGI